MIVVPIGGGGLIAGIGLWAKAVKPGLRLIGVQPSASPPMYAYFETGETQPMPIAPTLADGVAGNIERDSITWKLNRQLVDEVVVVDEEPIADAMRWAVEVPHLLLEGSAALGIAALQTGQVSVEGLSRRGRDDRPKRQRRHAADRARVTPAEARSRFEEARVARLATVGADGAPHIVPVTFALDGDTIVTAVDGKPKRGTLLRRVQNVTVNPRVSVLVTPTTRTGRASGGPGPMGLPRPSPRAPNSSAPVVALRARYPQYATVALAGPAI